MADPCPLGAVATDAISPVMVSARNRGFTLTPILRRDGRGGYFARAYFAVTSS